MEPRLFNSTNGTRPVVLCFSGHDPGGGAGIQADIEAIAAAGSHATTCITALTDQDSQTLYSYQPIDPVVFKERADHIIADLKPAVIKVGMVGSRVILAAIIEIVRRYPNLSLIVDPVLAAGGGECIGWANLHAFITERAGFLCRGNIGCIGFISPFLSIKLDTARRTNLGA